MVISTWRWPLQSWMSAELRTHRWAPETDLQWGPRHLDGHREKTSGIRWVLYTIWLCCSWNRLSLVSPKVFSPFCHRWIFASLPLSPLACLVGTLHFQRYCRLLLPNYCRHLNWTELDDAITEFNNEMPLTVNWVFNLFLHNHFTLLTHYFTILILCSCFDNLYC